jgi:predicted ATPase
MESKKKLVDDIKGMFERDSKRKIFQKYIEYIRFPFFKNFEANLKINFNFPVIFIVGQNGSGKSSLLHALYGAPKGKSVGDFWYTTNLDEIKELKNNRHRFIYSYVTRYTKQQVEVLKTRIKRKNNPDYWEPAAPKVSDGMTKINDYDKKPDKSEASSDRWNQLDKNVYHLDFRYSLSAYDKYFYFGQKPNTKTLKSKQDIIRKYAPKLKQAFDYDQKVTFRTRKVDKPIYLTQEEIKEIKYILGKDYVKAKISEHNLYDKNYGFAIRYTTENLTYSEAYAGSGETAVVKLVHDLCYAKDYSLILLDEPETSLHPLAQKRLINFILEQIKKKKLQVVISTHSPDIIEGMPKEAIEILYENQNTGKVNVIENVYPGNAFIHIGRTFTGKKVILTEDKLAKMIVEAVLEKNGDEKLFDVVYHPGGASQIKQNEMTVYSKEKNSKYFIVFDGDQKEDKIDISILPGNDKKPNILKEKIKTLVREEIKFSFDSNALDEQKNGLMLDYIKYHHDNVFFLPRNIPEEIIWNDDVVNKSDFSPEERQEIISETNPKKKYALYAKYEFNSDSADDIEKIHKKFIKRWSDNKNDDLKDIVDIISKLKGR